MPARAELTVFLFSGALLCGLIAVALFASRGGDHRHSCALAVDRHTHTDVFRDEERIDFFGFSGPDRCAARDAGEDAATELLGQMDEKRTWDCSTECQCTHAGLATYGRWCGYRHSGCDGYGACDMLDECCQTHDYCVGAHGHTDCNCTTALAKCAMCAYSARMTAEDTCALRKTAALRILSDIRHVLPSCFEHALETEK